MKETSVPARRTGYPYLVQTLADLSAELRLLVEQWHNADDPIRTIIVIPPQSIPKKLGGMGGVRSVPEQALLFTAHGVLHVQGSKSAGQPEQAAYLRAEDLLCAHLIIVLLYGKLELCRAAEGGLTRIVVEYNAARHDLIQPELHRLLDQASKRVTDEPRIDDSTDVILEELGQQSFKFKSGLRDYALTPRERLSGYVFQPRITKRYWYVFPRLVAPASLVALTDKELILIEEGRTNATSYGWYFTFCPRINIAGIEAIRNGDLYTLCVRLKKGGISTEQQTTLDVQSVETFYSLWLRNPPAID